MKKIKKTSCFLFRKKQVFKVSIIFPTLPDKISVLNLFRVWELTII